MSKRIVFAFDNRSYEVLKAFKEQGCFTTLADAVRTSLMIARALQEQAKFGFTEVRTRNAETGEENVLIIPPIG